MAENGTPQPNCKHKQLVNIYGDFCICEECGGKICKYCGWCFDVPKDSQENENRETERRKGATNSIK